MNFLRSRLVVTFFIAFIIFILHSSVIQYLMYSKVHTEIIPLLEETSKFIALTVSPLCGVFWTSMFAAEEGLSYILKYREKTGLFQIVIIRIVAFLFHFFLLGVQYYGLITYRKTGIFRYRIYLFVIAVGFHYLWNMGASMFVLYYVVEPVLNFLSFSLVRG